MKIILTVIKKLFIFDAGHHTFFIETTSAVFSLYKNKINLKAKFQDCNISPLLDILPFK